MGVLLTFIVAFILEFLIIAGLSWVACWALGLLGITVIWTWTLALACSSSSNLSGLFSKRA